MLRTFDIAHKIRDYASNALSVNSLAESLLTFPLLQKEEPEAVERLKVYWSAYQQYTAEDKTSAEEWLTCTKRQIDHCCALIQHMRNQSEYIRVSGDYTDAQCQRN